MKKQPAVLFSGYFGFDNAGDEAVLAAVIQKVRQTLPAAKLVVLSAQPEATTAALQAYEVEAIDRKNPAAIKQALTEAALLVSGGGSLFQDATSVRSVYYYASILNMAHKAQVPVMVLAQGLGPLSSWLGRMLTKKAISKAASISWRDEDSFILAKEIGLPAEKMYVTCDPVLLWQPTLSPNKKTVQKNIAKVVLAIRPWRDMSLLPWQETVQGLQQAGYEVELLPFHHQVDEAIAEELNQRLEQPLPILSYQGPEGIYQQIAGADFVVGMRLHALIMAAAAGTPAAAVSYDPKIDSFARQAGIPLVGSWQQFSAKDVVRAVQTGLQTKPNLQRELWQELWQRPLAEMKQLYQQGCEK